MKTKGAKPCVRTFTLMSCVVMSWLLTSCGQQDPAFKEERTTNQHGDGDLTKAGSGSGGTTSEDGSMENGLADTEGGQDGVNGSGQMDGGGEDGLSGSGSVDSGDGSSGGGKVVDKSGGGSDGGSDGGIGSEPGVDVVHRTVTATQQGPGKVDILWIVDSSGSMSEEQTYLGNNFNSFITQLVSAGHDFQTAVTTTDVCQDQIPSDLSQRVCPVDYGGTAATHLRGSFVGDTGRKVLKYTDSDIVSRFTSYTKVGTNGSGFEHGLKAAQMAIEKVTNGENESLIRADAFLAVIVVSDEEDDGIGLSMTDPANGRNFTADGLTTFKFTEDNMINYLKVIKGEGHFSVSAIAATRNANGTLCSAPHSNPPEEGTQYIKAAQKTGGIIQSICETNWSTSLAQIGYDLNAQITQIVLPSKPDVATIKVQVNGTIVSGWSYNEGNNAVKFDPSKVPAPGASIKIDYVEVQ